MFHCETLEDTTIKARNIAWILSTLAWFVSISVILHLRLDLGYIYSSLLVYALFIALPEFTTLLISMRECYDLF